MSSIMVSREESERVIGKRLRKKKKEGNDAPLREDQQPHHWKARTGVAAPLRRIKTISSKGARCSRTIEKQEHV